ncbi:MAG: HNH endonuclease [Gemmataceae bacterium]|nr:HNH endonuclease [Gemmataceae bacterium]
MKPKVRRDGRLSISLRREGHTKHFQIHRLVLLAFVGPCPPGMEGCHGDGNPLNNNRENLRWDTSKANHADAVRHGTKGSGDASGRSKLTSEQVIAMRAEYAAGGISHSQLSKKYGVSPGNIGFILNRKTWTCVA